MTIYWAGQIPSMPVNVAGAAITMKTICHKPIAWPLGADEDSAHVSSSPPALHLCHCYLRHFVENLRQRPSRRGFRDISSKPQVIPMQPSTPPMIRVELIAKKSTADYTYTYQIPVGSLRPLRQAPENSLASICILIRNFIGDQWNSPEVHFEHPRSGSSSNPTRAYDQAFHAPDFTRRNVNRLAVRKTAALSQAFKVWTCAFVRRERHATPGSR